MNIETLTKPYMKNRKNLALTVGIIRNGEKEIITKYASKPNEEKNSSKLLYEIGSITKVFTSTLLAKAISEGKLTLDDPIMKFIPSLSKNKTLVKNPVTIRHLTTHTSGIPSIPNSLYLKLLFSKKTRSNPYIYISNEDILKFLEKHNFQKSKRKFNYSNTGTGLLGYILTELYELDYETMIQKEITSPLNLSNTSIQIDEEQKTFLLQGHNNKSKPMSNWDFSSLEGAGALRSNASDLLLFLEAHMKGEPAYFTQTHDILYEDKNMAVGMNWIVDQKRNVIWHNGGTGGYSSFMGFNKEKQIGVVVLSNYQPSLSMTNPVDEIGFRMLEQIGEGNHSL